MWTSEIVDAAFPEEQLGCLEGSFGALQAAS